MLEWLEVRLEVWYDKKDSWLYEYGIELLKCDRDALKQECRLARIACSGTQPPTHLSEKIQRARSYCPQSLECDWYKKKNLGETRILLLLPRDGKLFITPGSIGLGFKNKEKINNRCEMARGQDRSAKWMRCANSGGANVFPYVLNANFWPLVALCSGRSELAKKWCRHFFPWFLYTFLSISNYGPNRAKWFHYITPRYIFYSKQTLNIMLKVT